jgi:hypothetical protein
MGFGMVLKDGSSFRRQAFVSSNNEAFAPGDQALFRPGEKASSLRTGNQRMRFMEAKSPVPNTAEKMKSVKAAWDKAPAGPKKDAALKHYQSAEKAMAAKHDGECRRELDAATSALA